MKINYLEFTGWKSLIDRQSFWLTLKRPFGVVIYIDGGLNGNSKGNTNLPW